MDPSISGERSGEAGFTIIEVLVASVILVVGVLSTLVLLEGGLASTRATTAREQGTNLAREVVERSRQLEYTTLTAAAAPGLLRAALPDAGPMTGSSFTVQRRGRTYTVTIGACSIDDPSDGIGYGAPAQFCAGATGGGGPGGGTGNPPTATAAGVTVLGVNASIGGSLLATVCNTVGTGNPVFNSLSGLLSSAAPTSLCPGGGSQTVNFDSRPDDLRRIAVLVAWNENGARSVSQVTLLTNGLPNNCPTTTPVAPAVLPAGCPTPIS
ncbi:MAG: prepilin-type N-terminal cleavage/methylation domain-containing protein [Solirubrobacterales bacterium]|nr:prepilin-type N-terminal cleavage/methylation domain-containing protein [Solirubrobacterales bacterium]